MPDTTQPEAVKPYAFDTATFEKKVSDINADIKAKSGKQNFNPHKWSIDSGFSALVSKYKLGEKSKELFDAMASLPSTVPCINPDWTPPVVQKPEVPKALRPPSKP